MTRGASPRIPAIARRQNKTHCARDHEISGWNARPRGEGNAPTCRACHATNLWARRNNLFQDDPRVVEHAAKLVQLYRAKTQAGWKP